MQLCSKFYLLAVYFYLLVRWPKHRQTLKLARGMCQGGTHWTHWAHVLEAVTEALEELEKPP